MKLTTILGNNANENTCTHKIQESPQKVFSVSSCKQSNTSSTYENNHEEITSGKDF